MFASRFGLPSLFQVVSSGEHHSAVEDVEVWLGRCLVAANCVSKL